MNQFLLSAPKLNYVMSQKGKVQLERKGFVYVQEKTRNRRIYWRCVNYTTKMCCRGRIHTNLDGHIYKETPHRHKPFDIDRISKARK